jgi:hypothetical protein
MARNDAMSIIDQSSNYPEASFFSLEMAKSAGSEV